VYFSEAPEHLHQYRFGHAVAASSCVPGLFTPIVINELYPDRTVRLVDGGVHDNQGTRALLDQDCDSVVVSDASGQMDAERNPAHSELGVVSRTNSVLQARVRISQHQELQARNRFGLLRRCTFLHLRKRIESAPVAALGAVAATREVPAGGARNKTDENSGARNTGSTRNCNVAIEGTHRSRLVHRSQATHLDV
jgi:predicted acylesterase/phospholipase RssA